MTYGLVGEHIAHSFSPTIHSALGNSDYRLFETDINGFDRLFVSKQFDGVNVTMPYKRVALEHCDILDPSAEATGAVNTVVNKNGVLYGYNTDVFGFIKSLEYANINVFGKKAFILGSGGAALAARYALLSKGAVLAKIVSRHKERDNITYDELYQNASDAEIIVGATPIGSVYFDGCLLDETQFENLECYFDLIYNPLRTEQMQRFARNGVKTFGGLYMLVAQAAASHERFFDSKVSDSDIEKIYNFVLKQNTNIALVGMPGSGKSTVGLMLAQRLSRQFFDTDEMFIKKHKISPGDYILQFGEIKFRTLEKEIIKEISQKQGVIIATGGGSVLDQSNRMALCKNSAVFYLYRGIDSLEPLPDRPLSDSYQKLAKMLDVRDGIYREMCDCVIESLEPNKTADQIIKRVGV